MSKNLDRSLSADDRSSQHEEEQSITNSRQNRSFIDQILKSRDAHAIGKLFEEYFYLHADKRNGNRITWSELHFIVNELLQRTDDELNLTEATKLFEQMCSLHNHRAWASATSEKETQ